MNLRLGLDPVVLEPQTHPSIYQNKMNTLPKSNTHLNMITLPTKLKNPKPDLVMMIVIVVLTPTKALDKSLSI